MQLWFVIKEAQKIKDIVQKLILEGRLEVETHRKYLTMGIL